MVIVKLSSGLGNQLFMYAFFSYLKQENHDINIYFETQSFALDSSGRQSELELLFPNYPKDHGLKLLSGTKYRIVKRLREFFLVYLSNVLVIDDTNYKSSVHKIDKYKDYYFKGFWQTTYFFERLKNKEILFKPKEPMPESIRNVYNHINSCEKSASLHIRRGDYFSPLYVNRYGVCTKEYYETAVKTLIIKVPIATIFVFSDDLDWVKDNINFPNNIVIVYVDNYSVNSFWYIYLMSLCCHNIISNSTFSWWGAYLNANQNKFVICPSRWRFDTDENLALDSWCKINT